MEPKLRTWKTAGGELRTSWRVAYSGDDGRQKFKQFQTKREALAFINDRASGDDSSRSATKLSDALDLFLVACEKGREGRPALERHTMRAYEGYASNYLKPAAGDLRLNSLDRNAVRRIRDQITQKAPSRPTARKIFSMFKTACAWWADIGFISANPSDGVTIERDRRTEATKEFQIYTDDEIGALLQAADWLFYSKHPQTSASWSRYRPMLRLLIDTGMRCSEVRGLNRQAIKETPNGWVVSITQRADKNGVIGPPKSADGVRKLLIQPHVAEDCIRFADTHKHGLMFANKHGNPVDQKNLETRMWNKVVDAAGVRRLNLHTLRHYFASKTIESTSNLKLIQKMMGHAQIQTTMDIYGHLIDGKNLMAEQQALLAARRL